MSRNIQIVDHHLQVELGVKVWFFTIQIINNQFATLINLSKENQEKLIQTNIFLKS